MISRKKIEELIADKLCEGDYFIVSLDVSTTNKIKLVIDSIKGITIDECVAFSRAIEHNLDREEEDFELEVTSPGLTSPLLVKEQYLKNIGRELEVHTSEGVCLKGTLLEVSDSSIKLIEEKKVKLEGHKKKQLVKTEHLIDFMNINKALIVIKF